MLFPTVVFSCGELQPLFSALGNALGADTRHPPCGPRGNPSHRRSGNPSRSGGSLVLRDASHCCSFCQLSLSTSAGPTAVPGPRAGHRASAAGLLQPRLTCGSVSRGVRSAARRRPAQRCTRAAVGRHRHGDRWPGRDHDGRFSAGIFDCDSLRLRPSES